MGLAVKRFAVFDAAMSAVAAGTNATTLELKSSDRRTPASSVLP
ncbi:hypothetical protein ABEG17_02390 [Pedococcus sp. KACC 23699]|uniref:Uncharacterized protein n=1 Tax=Pedococcus sp. KACC 23699 TaxID=3149228 RepID=A0AAU7JVR0_9MICO